MNEWSIESLLFVETSDKMYLLWGL